MSAATQRSAWPSDKPIVVAQKLTKVFKDFWMRPRVRAVDSLDLEIYPGEVFGLLGPNGSGKSTTIKIILGLLHKTSGRVAVFGKPPTDVNVKKRIGYLPEESYLYPFLNARETLDYYGKLFELDHRARERRIDELLDMVGLAAVQRRQMHEYSKGMQRRIGLAQALINDPDLLILDEPTSGLDPIGAKQVKDLIIELGERGKTILLSSHLLADVQACVDRAVILYGGRIQAQGTIEALVTESSHTLIETDALDEDALREVERVLQSRGGARLLRVDKPRRSLEALFMEIVERAQQQRIDTSGALAGGQTASFLRADQADAEPQPLEGDALLQTLAATPTPPAAEHAAAEDDGETDTTAAQSDNVLEQLTAHDPLPSSDASSTAADDDEPAAQGVDDEGVDQSVLQSLVGEATNERDEAEDQR